MKLTVVLAILLGTLGLACSSVTPVPAEPTPNIDATVEAKVAQERAVDATVEAKVSGTLSAPGTKAPSTTQAACKLTGGETVQSGWTGKDTGDNSCNSCFCTNGVLGCTKMACPAHQVSSNSKPTPTRPPTLTTKSTPTRPPTSTTKPTPTPEPTIKPESTTEVAPTATLAWREYVYTSEGERVKVVPPPTVPLSKEFPKLVKAHRLPHLTFHGLRHAHATLALTAGINPKIVSERLGHSSVAVTMDIYSHVLPGMQEEAALAVENLLGRA